MPVTYKQAVTRTAGQRAGMTRAKIATAAVKLWREGGPEKFTIRALASALKVAPTTVYAHFKKGVSELKTEMAVFTLEALTPHYKPKQDPKDYLRTFLLTALETFRQYPHLGRLVIAELSADLLLSMAFLERFGMTMQALGGGKDVVEGVELLVGRLSGLALIEMGNWARAKPGDQKARVQVSVYNTPAAEIPTLKSAAQSLGAGLAKRAAENYLSKLADRLTETLIADWKKI